MTDTVALDQAAIERLIQQKLYDERAKEQEELERFVDPKPSKLSQEIWRQQDAARVAREEAATRLAGEKEQLERRYAEAIGVVRDEIAALDAPLAEENERHSGEIARLTAAIQRVTASERERHAEAVAKLSERREKKAGPLRAKLQAIKDERERELENLLDPPGDPEAVARELQEATKEWRSLHAARHMNSAVELRYLRAQERAARLERSQPRRSGLVAKVREAVGA